MNPGPHVRHIVMWNIAGASPAEKRANIERLRQGFERLRGRIPGLLQLDIGVDSSGVDYAWAPLAAAIDTPEPPQ